MYYLASYFWPTKKFRPKVVVQYKGLLWETDREISKNDHWYHRYSVKGEMSTVCTLNMVSDN
jgi:hypothetical protein